MKKNSQFYLLAGLLIINVISLLIIQKYRIYRDGLVTYGNKTKYSISEVSGYRIKSMVTIKHDGYYKNGCLHQGSTHDFHYQRHRTGYVITSIPNAERDSYSIKINAYKLDDKCNILIYGKNDLDSLWLNCQID